MKRLFSFSYSFGYFGLHGRGHSGQIHAQNGAKRGEKRYSLLLYQVVATTRYLCIPKPGNALRFCSYSLLVGISIFTFSYSFSYSKGVTP